MKSAKNSHKTVLVNRITLEDIVRESGMSRSTVGRALAGNGYVSPDKKQHILETAERLGYRVSTLVRAAHPAVYDPERADR